MQQLSTKKIKMIPTVQYCEHSHKREYYLKKAKGGEFEPNMY